MYDFTIHYHNGYTITNDAPQLFPVGNTTVTWNVTDPAGNTVTDTQTVSITQGELPVMLAPDDITVQSSDAQSMQIDIGTPSVMPLPKPDYTHNTGFVDSYGAVIPDSTISQIDSITADMGGTWIGGSMDGLQSAGFTRLGDNKYLLSANDDIYTKGVIVQLMQNGTDVLMVPIESRYKDGFDQNLATSPYHTASAAYADREAGYGIAGFTIHYTTGYSITNNAPESFPAGNTTVTWSLTDGFGRTNTDTQTVTVNPVS